MTSIFKKVAIIAIAAVTMSGVANAQTPSFVKGDNVAGVSIGFGGYYSGTFYKGSGISRMPFIAAYYENCVKDNLWDDKSSLGIGGMVGYTQIKIADWYTVSDLILGVRGALHYAFVDKLDTYTGLMLGYDIYNIKWADGSTTHIGEGTSGLAISWFLGARYYFTDNFAAFAELGYGVAVINFGVSIKF